MDLKHISLLGLNLDMDLGGKRVLEINNGTALCLKFGNAERKLIYSIQHPGWIIRMYNESGIQLQFSQTEGMIEQGWDEVWAINALQNSRDIERSLFNIKHSASTLRIYQELDSDITRAILDAGLGICGAVTTLHNISKADPIGVQQEIYYGCYDLANGEKMPLRSNMQFWGGNIERAMIHYLKAQYPHRLIMAEVGVLHGVNAKFILDTLNVKHLYLIDPYQQYDTDIYSQADLDQAKANAKALLAPYRDRITWLYVKSLDAISILRNMQVELDATYYDGDHSYAGTYKNIEVYNQITRLWLGGHDYIPDMDNPGCQYGVMSAVQQWTLEHEYNFFCSDFPFSDWWIDKMRR